MSILGLHHVTATVSDAQEDLDFATGALGLRLVKKTVNFDNHGVYHLYYGNENGTPGTVWTTFPYRDRGVPVGEKGLGQITVTSFSVPAGSLDFWRSRLESRGLPVGEPPPRFGEDSLVVTDPSGLAIELVGTNGDRRVPWTGNGIPLTAGVRGLHSVTLQSRAPGLTRRLLMGPLGFRLVEETQGRFAWESVATTPASWWTSWIRRARRRPGTGSAPCTTSPSRFRMRTSSCG
ncbi:MAG TPA: VOC family protein [Gemmatimonadales bacterium]|nr:VOC family protein [Gemmatimonadales bacterium]